MNRLFINDEDHKTIDEEIDLVVKEAVNAQREIETWSDEKVNTLLSDLVLNFSRDLAYFARREVEETGIGNETDKKHKLSLVAETIVGQLLKEKTIGELKKITPRLIEYASPMGVIFAVIPMTNPVPNSLFKTILSIKTRNALIVSYPKAATNLGLECMEIIQSTLRKHGAPQYLIQNAPLPSTRERSGLLMSHRDVNLILATGGGKLVQAAYRSGTPAYGVGPGNVPVLVTDTADLQQTAADIIKGKSYDNGIVCGSESNLIVSETICQTFIVALEDCGAAVLTPDESKRVAQTLFDSSTSRIRREYVGVDCQTLAEKTGVSRPWSIKVLIMPTSEEELPKYSREKMAPLLTLLAVDVKRSIELAKRMLLDDGAGHTAVIHSKDINAIKAFAEQIPAGRLLVNTPATHGMLGETTEIPRTFMAGCGSWGGNISTDGITWRHLVNIKMLAYDTDKNLPS